MQGQKCTKIDLRACLFSKVSWGSMPPDPLVCHVPTAHGNELNKLQRFIVLFKSSIAMVFRLIIRMCACYRALNTMERIISHEGRNIGVHKFGDFAGDNKNNYLTLVKFHLMVARPISMTCTCTKNIGGF